MHSRRSTPRSGGLQPVTHHAHLLTPAVTTAGVRKWPSRGPSPEPWMAKAMPGCIPEGKRPDDQAPGRGKAVETLQRRGNCDCLSVTLFSYGLLLPLFLSALVIDGAPDQPVCFVDEFLAQIIEVDRHEQLDGAGAHAVNLPQGAHEPFLAEARVLAAG